MRGSEFAEMKAFAAIVERASFARPAGQGLGYRCPPVRFGYVISTGDPR